MFMIQMNLFSEIFQRKLNDFILFSTGVGNHHTEVWRQLIKIDVSILAAVCAVHGPIELLLTHGRVGMGVYVLFFEVTKIIHALL